MDVFSIFWGEKTKIRKRSFRVETFFQKPVKDFPTGLWLQYVQDTFQIIQTKYFMLEKLRSLDKKLVKKNLKNERREFWFLNLL